MSSTPPDPAPTSVSSDVDAVVSGEWPDRLRVLLLSAALKHLTEKARGAPFDETDESLIVALAAFAAGAIETTELVAVERERAAAEERARARRELLGLRLEERLPTEIETVVYRVVQEALTNVVRHAGASTASVTLIPRDGHIRVFIEDDGVGFDPGQRHMRPHLGIQGMLERAELAEGSLSITSTPGNGTVVLLEVSRG